MVEVKNLHTEITSFLKREFDIEEYYFDNEEVIDKEVSFQLKPHCDGAKIKEALHEHFGNSLMFHACEMGGILGILIEEHY